MPSQPATQLKAIVAANLDAAITRKGLTNRALGDQIGATEHQVWRWRRGKNMPNSESLGALAAVLFDGDLQALFAEPERAVA